MTMPYVFYEELPEGAEEAMAVSADEHQAALDLVEELSSTVRELEDKNVALADRASAAEKESSDVKRRYADAFLAKPIEKAGKDFEEANAVMSASGFASLFGGDQDAN